MLYLINLVFLNGFHSSKILHIFFLIGRKKIPIKKKKGEKKVKGSRKLYVASLRSIIDIFPFLDLKRRLPIASSPIIFFFSINPIPMSSRSFDFSVYMMKSSETRSRQSSPGMIKFQLWASSIGVLCFIAFSFWFYIFPARQL